MKLVRRLITWLFETTPENPYEVVYIRDPESLDESQVNIALDWLKKRGPLYVMYLQPNAVFSVNHIHGETASEADASIKYKESLLANFAEHGADAEAIQVGVAYGPLTLLRDKTGEIEGCPTGETMSRAMRNAIHNA